MFRGDWGKYAKIAGLAAAFLLSTWGVYSDLTSVSDSYEHSAADASKHYAENAEKLIRDTCPTLPAANQVDCVNKADQTARENQRVEQDLAAQKVTAWWTKIMGVAALIGMALSAVGVFLVYTTFDETRKANEIAKDSAERQMRAYVTVGGVEINRTKFIHATVSRPKFEEWEFCIELVNQGDTPAFIKHFCCWLEWQEEDGSHTLVSKAERTVQFLVRRGGSFWVSANIENDLWQRPKTDQTLYVLGEVIYLNIFGKGCVTTFRHYAKKDDRECRADKIFTHTSMTGNTSE